MKIFYTLLIGFLLSSLAVKAQYVTIPDANFRAFLKSQYPGCFNGADMMDTTCTAILTATELNCSGLGIANLVGIQYFKSLQGLLCYNNPLMSLPELPDSLDALKCDNNQLTNLPELPEKLSTLFCGDNPNMFCLPKLPPSLLDIYLDTATNIDCIPNRVNGLSVYSYSFTVDSTDLDLLLLSLPLCDSTNNTNSCPIYDSITNNTSNCVIIPDSNFRAFLKSKYPACFNALDMMDTICISELDAIDIDCSKKNILSLEGIQYFKSIDELDCSDNLLTDIPALSPSLSSLKCNRNKLDTLPILPISLTYLSCSKNLLTSLPSLPDGLQYLYCDTNQLSNLPVLPTTLIDLHCYHNQLTALPSLPATLYFLWCDENQLTSLPDLPNGVYYLTFSANNITSLPKLPGALNSLWCDHNPGLTCLPKLPKFLQHLYVDSQSNIKCLPNRVAGLQTYAYTYVTNLGTPFYIPFCNEQNNLNFCPSFPDTINITLCPPNITTNITSAIIGTTYQWQIDTCSDFGNTCYQNLSNSSGKISGVNARILQLTNVPEFGNKYQFRCIVNSQFNSFIYRVIFSDTWVGGTSAAWETPSNWSCGKIPDLNTDVIIPNNKTVIINSNTIVRSLTVNPSSTVTVTTGHTLTVLH